MNQTPSNDNSHNDNTTPPKHEDLITAAAIIDQQLSNGEIVTIDPDLAEFMGAFEETAVSDEEALEAHLFPYGDQEDGEEKGDEA